MFYDSHIHLDDKKFDKDREEIISNFETDRIRGVINVGADMATSRASLELAKKHDKIYAVVGVHPHDVKDMKDSDFDELRAMSKEDKVVAIGEIGLDYYYDHSPRDVQIKRFEEELVLAKELDLPVVIHSRDAAMETLEIIKKHSKNLRGEMHAFSYSPEIMREYLKLGFYIALGGPVTFKNARVPLEVAREVPLDALLLETDAPFLTPEPFRGKRNESKYIKYIAEKIADIKGIPVSKIYEATAKNTEELFGL
ncbi:MAG: TatD family hydrolase [Tissierellia bacterium]|nr:TatD family hydrolase [Tissierellia bacterium]